MKAILTYHSIDRSGSPVSVSPEAFARHVAWLASGAVRAVSIPDLLAAEATEDAVAVTVDDGFTSLATEVWPRLRDHAVPLTVFVPTGLVGGTNAWDAGGRHGIPTLELLDWEALGRLAADGVAIEAHGRSHADLRSLTDAALEDEIAGSCADLAAQLGARPHGFAYPFGWFDDRVRAAARRAVSWACTTVFRPFRADEDPHRLPRLDAYYFREATSLRAWGTTRFRARVSAIGAARRVRRLLTTRGAGA